MKKVIDTFGPELIAMLVLAAVTYFLISLAPVLWPALRAFRRCQRLPRPWLFTAVVAALTYGTVYIVVAILAIPVQVYVVFFAPQFEEMGVAHGAWLVSLSRFIGEWWWVALPPAVLAMTFLLTRRLARRWPQVCAALAA